MSGCWCIWENKQTCLLGFYAIMMDKLSKKTTQLAMWTHQVKKMGSN